MRIGSRRDATFAFLLMVANLVLPSALEGQDSLCAPMDDGARGFLVYANLLARDSAAEMVASRETYGIQPVPESEIEIVSDEVTCTRASELLHAKLNYSGMLRPVRVVRIGTRYIIYDPAYDNSLSEFTPHIVCDDDFRVLALFAG